MKERFRELRKSLQLSQTDFAEKMGVTRSMINNLERGVVEPKEFLVNLACKTYGVNRTWLETGEGEMQPDTVAPAHGSSLSSAAS